MRIARLTLLLALALVGACAEGASKLCRDVCQRELACVEEQQASGHGLRFDKGECVTTCTALERDPQGAELVKRHADCVARAGSCAELLACP